MHRRLAAFPALALALGLGLFAASPAQSGQDHEIRTANEQESEYSSAAWAYLLEIRSRGGKVLQAIQSMQDGSSSNDDLRKAMSHAKLAENASYQDDYLGRVDGVVPSSFASSHRQIVEVHRLFQASMDEFLKYWEDSNVEHIGHATAIYKQCFRRLGNATVSLDAKLEMFKAD